jgi:hypothetical protein
MDLDNETLSDFADRMQETYEEQSILPELANLVEYTEKDHQELDYVQIGKRIWLPLDFITTTVEVTNAQRLLRAVTGGEKRFLLEHLSDIPADQLLLPDDSKGFSIASMRSAAAQIRNPDYAFVPNTARYNTQLQEWEAMDRVSYDNGEVLDIDGGVRVRWVPEGWGYENIYLVSRSGVNVVQKQFEDAPTPRGMDIQPGHQSLSAGQNLMMYFGEIKEDIDDESVEREVDFLFRVVLSEPQFAPQSICKIPPE